MKTVFITFFLLITFSSLAQSGLKDSLNLLDGHWGAFDDEGEFIGNYFVIKGDAIMKAASLDGEVVDLEYSQKSKGLSFAKKSYQMGNNAFYIWTATCDDCSWTETQVYHFSLVEEGKIILHWHRIVNNSKGLDCFSEDGDCFTRDKTYVMELMDE